MNQMRLKMNDAKTEYIILENERHVHKCEENVLNLCCESIEGSDNVKYLGGYLDKELNMKEHINAKCKAAWCNFKKIKVI